MNNNDLKQGHKDTNFLNLSASELSIMHDKEFFMLKRIGMEKIVSSFAELESLITLRFKELRDAADGIEYRKRGNISKGENYLGLPYVILDHPSVFGKSGIIAFRTMFWWGNGFSITFHVSGLYLKILSERFFESILHHCPENYLLGIGNGEWDHHFEPHNFATISSHNFIPEQLLKDANDRGFLKIADKWEIDQANETPDRVINFLCILNDALKKS